VAGGLRWVRPRLRVPGQRGLPVGRRAPGRAADHRAGRVGGAGRRVQRGVPAPVAGGLAADRSDRRTVAPGAAVYGVGP
jgi:hypothetical protein